MMFICVFSISLVIVRLFTAIGNYLSFVYLPEVAPIIKEPYVSILIPARNEEANIGALLRQLSTLTYHNHEIIVYDDYSTDKTEDIVKYWAVQNGKITLINGTVLPRGWLGKNYACHQLSQVAKGEVLLFLDADVSVGKNLITRSVTYFEKHELHLLSIFPKQMMKSFGEKVSVPLLNWILLSLLPLFLLRRLKHDVFSAANGQFMMFDAITYHTIWPHEKYKSHGVEDMAIMRLFKRKGLAGDIRLGDDDISCRMYDGMKMAIDGFTKNIFQFFGASKLVTIYFAFITTMAPFILYYKLGIWWVIVYMIGTLSIRVFVSLASQQSVVLNLVLALPQHMVFLTIIVKGLITNKKKKLLWKGRNILQDL